MRKTPFKRNPYLRDKFRLTDFTLQSRFYCTKMQENGVFSCVPFWCLWKDVWRPLIRTNLNNRVSKVSLLSVYCIALLGSSSLYSLIVVNNKGYNDYADKTECHSPNFSLASKTTGQMGHPVQAPKNNIPFCLAECALPWKREQKHQHFSNWKDDGKQNKPITIYLETFSCN